MLKDKISAMKRLWAGLPPQAKGAPSEPSPHSFLERLSDPSRHGSEEMAGQLRARQVNAIQRLSIPLMLVNLVNIGALLLELWLSGQISGLSIAWSAFMTVVVTGVLIKSWKRRNRAVPRVTSTATVRRVVRSALCFGLLWSVPGLVILPQLSGMALAFSTALLTGMIAGGAIVLYPIPAAATAFLLPVAASGVAGLVYAQGWLAVGPAILAGAFICIFLGVVRRHSELFVSEFVSRLDLEQRNRLIEDLLEDARLEVLGAQRLAAPERGSERTTAVVGQVTAGMAHYFNNLLTVLQGNAELLAREAQTDRTLIEPIIDACHRGASSVRRLLAAAERQSLEPEPVPLEDVVGSFQRAYQSSLGPRIRVLSRIEDMPCKAWADREKLESALFELMENARNAISESGEIVISCRHVPAGVIAAGEREAVSVTVRDTGRGMDPATRRRATEPFFTTRPPAEANGLGLAAATGFARQSGGSLEIESWPGSGTSVTLYLPRDRTGGSESPSTRPAAQQINVLVVESEPEMRTEIVSMLRDLGHGVMIATEPESGVRILHEGRDVHVVLTNILLDGAMSGVQLGRMIQEMRPEIRIVFISHLPNSDRDGRRLDPDGPVLAYPFTKSELETHIRRTLAATDAFA